MSSDPFADGGDESVPAEPAEGEIGSASNPVPAPSNAWSMGIVSDPLDYSHDQDPEVLAALAELDVEQAP